MIEVYKRRKSDWRPLWCYFKKKHCKNDSLEADSYLACASRVLPFSCVLSCPFMLGLTSNTICCSSSSLLCGETGQLGQLLWSGRCPLGAQIRPGSFLCVSKAKISTWWKAVEFISQSTAQTLFFFSATAFLGWDDYIMLLIMLDPSVFLNTCA